MTLIDDVRHARATLRDVGWFVVHDVIDADRVAAARTICDTQLVPDAADEETEIPATALLRIPQLVGLLFDAQLLRAMREMIGGPVTYYPNYVARLNRYTDWHVDNAFLPSYHDDPVHLYDPDFCHLQCAIYLQDNEPTVGGGLDVVPRSHRWATEGVEPANDILLDRYGDVVSVGTRAGDLLVFDGRLLHRGTPSATAPAIRKYALFWSASRNDERQAGAFLRYLGGRGDHLREIGLTDESFGYMLQRYDDVLHVQFPATYLPETVAAADAHDVRVVSIPAV